MFEKHIRLIGVTESTNALLSAEAETGLAQEGFVIRTEHQTAGRGRLDRSWESPPGRSILFSALLFPDIELNKLSVIGLMVSMVIQDALKIYFNDASLRGELAADSIKMKWPNDILANGQKLCGILCESGTNHQGQRYVVIGAGLNVNQNREDFSPEIRKTATSLKILSGKIQDRERLFNLIISQLSVYYNKIKTSGVDWIVPDWINKSGIIGKWLKVKQQNEEITGICIGLEDNGALQLRLKKGEIVNIYSGDAFAG